MPSTESRSRDEWLAEVRRRGERIRRRRRLAFALAGALAMVMPVTAVATFLHDTPSHEVELVAAGPTATTSRPDLAGPVPDSGPETLGLAPQTPEGVAEPFTRSSPTATAEVPTRAPVIEDSPVTTVAPPTTVPPPVDDPVVRVTTTTSPPPPSPSSPSTTTTVAPARGGAAAASTTVPPDPPTGTWCKLDEVRGRVAMDKPVFAVGEPVRGTSSLENRSAISCLLLFDSVMSIRDAADQSVDSVKQAEFKKAVKVEPGMSFTTTFTWDQKACAAVVVEDVYPVPRERCPQAAPGLYTVHEWSAPDNAPASFRISA